MLTKSEAPEEEKVIVTGKKVLITSAYPDPDPISTFFEFAKLDKFKKHRLTDSADDADIILFIENSRYGYDYFFGRLKKNPLVKKYPEKVFMYNPHDVPWFILRGMYTCMPRERFDSKLMAASPYIEIVNEYIQCDFSTPPKLLYSFYGAPSSVTRREIFKMPAHPRGVVIDSPAHIFFSDDKPQSAQMRYASLMTESKFVLAPKGYGPSSLRLFEVMKAGRVPVIISDKLVYPAGPDWSKCSVAVPEDQIHKIPELLEKEEAGWPEKSRLARKAWEDYFAPDSMFNYFVESALELKKNEQKMSLHLKYLHLKAMLDYMAGKIARENLKGLRKFFKKAP